MFKIFIISFFLLCLSGCTYSVILTDTHGVSSDVVDEEQRARANITPPNISIPLTP